MGQSLSFEIRSLSNLFSFLRSLGDRAVLALLRKCLYKPAPYRLLLRTPFRSCRLGDLWPSLLCFGRTFRCPRLVSYIAKVSIYFWLGAHSTNSTGLVNACDSFCASGVSLRSVQLEASDWYPSERGEPVYSLAADNLDRASLYAGFGKANASKSSREI